MPSPPDGKIYSATYSNVPVYEFNVAGTPHHVMRRRADDWINATHILKVADFDKPARTRILEREVQKGVHEKVQGGYGKYQGTWVPLHEGRILAERNNVLETLLPILDYVPGDRSPPPAPKHATQPNRPKAPRVSAAAARRNAFLASQSQVSETQYEEPPIHSQQPQAQIYRDGTPDNETVVSESLLGDQDVMDTQQYPQSSRKRKRGSDQLSVQDSDHQLWADRLLDYFMLLGHEDMYPEPPEPPANVNLDRAIDEKGHTALHWAAAMGDVAVTKELIARGARTDCVSNNLETPLMRAVMFTNNFDKQTMSSMVKILQSTVVRTDWFGSTVFHHIAATTSSSSKFLCARYYLDCIINKLSETWIPEEVNRLLNAQDKNGDTATHIAARNGARKLTRALLGRSVSMDIVNNKGETVDDLIRSNRARRVETRPRQASSSPFAPPDKFQQHHNGFDIFDNPLYNERNHDSRNRDRNGSRERDLQRRNSRDRGDRSGGGLFATSFSHAHKENSEQKQICYRSITASHLMTKVAPTLFEKCEELALAYESELQEKEFEAVDAERVVKKRTAELEAVRKQVVELVNSVNGADGMGGPGGMGMGDLDDEGVDIQQERELSRLVREAESLLETEQKLALRSLCNSRPAQNFANSIDLNEKMRLSLLLAHAQIERRELVREVVGHLGAAGMSERQGVYKSLIAKAIGEREEDVEEWLPEMLRELEEVEDVERAEGLEGSPL